MPNATPIETEKIWGNFSRLWAEGDIRMRLHGLRQLVATSSLQVLNRLVVS